MISLKNQASLLIGIDGNEANLKNRVGVNMFALGVLWGLHNLRKKSRAGERYLIFLKQSPLLDLPPETDWWKYEILGRGQFWTWTVLVKRLFKGSPKPDVFFTPSHYGPAFSPIPLVVSIMDLGFLKFPEQFTKKDLFQLKTWTKWSARKASKVIAISEFTKKDVVSNYGLGKDKVVVAYPGYKKTKSLKLKAKSYSLKLKAIRKKYGIKGDYLFYLGTLKPSKNIVGLVEAYRILLKENPSLKVKLVIAGKKGWLYEEIFNKVNQLGLGDKVVFTGFVEDEEVPVLIKGAEVFCIPSFWEGFGFPVLEAMSLGVPVVAGKAGSLPEIVGKAGVLVDSYQPQEISKGIERLLKNKTFREEIIGLGKVRAKMFSWAKCSKIIRQTLVNLIKNKND